jgi:hypothetical protein
LNSSICFCGSFVLGCIDFPGFCGLFVCFPGKCIPIMFCQYIYYQYVASFSGSTIHSNANIHVGGLSGSGGSNDRSSGSGTGYMTIVGDTVISKQGAAGGIGGSSNTSSYGVVTIGPGGLWDTSYDVIGAYVVGREGTGFLTIDGGTLSAGRGFVNNGPAATIYSQTHANTTLDLTLDGTLGSRGAFLTAGSGRLGNGSTTIGGLPADQDGWDGRSLTITATNGGTFTLSAVNTLDSGTLSVFSGGLFITGTTNAAEGRVHSVADGTLGTTLLAPTITVNGQGYWGLNHDLTVGAGGPGALGVAGSGSVVVGGVYAQTTPHSTLMLTLDGAPGSRGAFLTATGGVDLGAGVGAGTGTSVGTSGTLVVNASIGSTFSGGTLNASTLGGT